MREFPAWVEGGEPLSWRHFVAGSRHLSMHRAREVLRIASGSSASHMPEREQKDWFHRQTGAAGWR